MMNKNKLFITISSFVALALSGCQKGLSLSPKTLKAGTENTVYLVLSSIGLYEGKAGENVPELYLENTVTYVGAVDSDLPGADKVTSIASSKSTFAGWVSYEGEGAPTTYTKVPDVANKILYAQFTTDGSGGSSGGNTDPEPDPTYKRLYCKVSQSWWTTDNASVGAYVWNGDTKLKAWPGTQMNKDNIHEDTWYIDIDTATYTNIIFVRLSPDGTTDWGAKTRNLTIPTDGKNLFTITSSTAVWGEPGADGEWSTLS